MREPKDVMILVVDDEETLRKALVFDFKRKGFQTLDASSGHEAFELVKKNKIDLVLSDVRMPGGDGIELLNRIKELNPVLPVVIFITGFADMSLDEAYNIGADAVFSKPFDRKALMASVMRALQPKQEAWGARHCERIDTTFEITLRFPHLDQAIRAKVLDIGRGGMFVALQKSFPCVEDKVAFQIQFNDGDLTDLSGTGTVRWVRSQVISKLHTGCGIEFDHLEDAGRDQIIELIERLKMVAFIPNT